MSMPSTSLRPRALVLTSNAVRHHYFIARIAETFEVVGAMSEPKRNYFTQARANSAAVEAHFLQLTKAETPFMAERINPAIMPTVIDDLNTESALAQAQALNPDVVCLFGTSILKAPWLEAFPNRIVNVHLGLSPYYRGGATLFWPFHDHNLACLGTTIHLAIAKVDAGAILKRIKPDFNVGDTYYTVTTRLIRKTLDAFPTVAMDYLADRIMPIPQEFIAGRVTKKSDFTETALLTALQYIEGGLTERMIRTITTSTACPC